MEAPSEHSRSDKNEQTESTTEDFEEQESVEGRYVFIDVVGFSTRTIETQRHVISALNSIVSKCLTEVGLHLKDPTSVICIPTGDGLCAAIIAREMSVNELLDLHLRLACAILRSLNTYNKDSDDTRRFQVRIGLNENTDTLVQDINGQKNIAGVGINEAARIMDLADGSQILVGQNVYTRLEARDHYRGEFKPYKSLVKHDRELTLYQYCPERPPADLELNTQTPAAIARTAQNRRDSELLVTKGLLFEGIRSVIAAAEQTVLVVSRHRSWIFPFAATFVMARHRNIQITYVYYPDSKNDENRGELKFLKQLGCAVEQHPVPDSAPFEGVFADYNDETRIRGVIATENPETAGYFGRKPQTKGDSRALLAMISSALPKEPSSKEEPLTVKINTEEEAKNWLERVPTYAGCQMQWKKVRLRDDAPVIFGCHRAQG